MKNRYYPVLYLWKYLGGNRKFKLFLFFVLMVLSVFADIISISAIIPFLSALTNPEILMTQEWFKPVIEILNIKSSNELLLPLTVGFVGASIFAAIIKIALLWFNSQLSLDMGVELKTKVFKKTLYQPYEYHISRNSSELISLVTQKVGSAIAAGILHTLTMVTAVINSVTIVFTLILIKPYVALTAFILFGGGYFIIGKIVKNIIKKNGEIIRDTQPLAVKTLQEGLGGIRDIIIDSNQDIFIKQYETIAYKSESAGMRNTFLANLPKHIMEVFSICLIAFLAYYMQVVKGETQSLPILGALALGAQKLLPSLQQIYYSWSLINANLPIMEEVVKQLNLKVKKSDIQDKLTFKNSIILKDISYKYANSKDYVLNNIFLEIKKSQKVGFIGQTGSGKSTLLDIIMGLLYPQKGEIFIDDIPINQQNISKWQKNIANVPQTIFLSDTSIAENIAFGIPKDKIDLKRVKEVAQMASLDNFIETLPKKYDTKVGERGVQLSGGQRQRIGIARALYKQAEVIVFDEATSALDDKTEKSVMDAINNLDKNLTILMIAHRLSTLKECDVIYEIENGTIKIVDKDRIFAK